MLEHTSQHLDEKLIEQIHYSNTEDKANQSEEMPLLKWTEQETAASTEVVTVNSDSQAELQAFNLNEDSSVCLTPVTMKETIDSLGMSIRQSALEIGIAHTTLSRYIRKENKRQNKNNDAKMLNWLKEKTKSKTL
ncbi:hypothetical protein M3172_24200 [Mesobacillus subterraneus]|uniref:hypothetical protein n=1 Tax=Mesobacillus subterraneus TaxID=285983 RepID=UPI0020425C88|nr:hypothetical protein [Mesobacillus subterraneus]MCM3576277.1 hypothetical protein [Mesobacillus subterraneus]